MITPHVRHVRTRWFVACLVIAMGATGCASLVVPQRSLHDLETRKSFTWDRHEANGMVVYTERSPHGAADARMVADSGAYARERILAYLDEPAFTPVINVFVLRDRRRMADLIGRETNATAYHTSNAVCVAKDNALLSRIAHEMLHVIAMNTWGIPARWVNEGVAVDADAAIRGINVHTLSRRLKQRGDLPSLHTIANRFETLSSERAYPAAGSVVRFVREAYGTDAVRALWEGGLPRLEAHTNASTASIEASWTALLDSEPSGD